MLLTGATGFVGMEVLARYLERGERPVTCLVRARQRRGRAGADRRMCCTTCSGEVPSAIGRRVDRVAAELTAPGLGLAARRREATRLVGDDDRPQCRLDLV